MKTLVISPTYNEKKNIKALVKQVLDHNPDYHLLVIDDNSPDGTASAVKELQTEYAEAKTAALAKKASGKQKLKDLGLDDEEIKELTGA